MSDDDGFVLPANVDAAVRHLQAGHLVALPTETVYGLGGDATNPAAVARIFQMKGRPTNHPLIVHLADAQQLTDWATEIPSSAWLLADAFWPGPLTLILQAAAHVDRCVTGGMDTIAVRVPQHPVASAVLRAFGRGIAAPSANRFGRVSPTTAEHVRQEFAGVDGSELLILEGGSCEVGLESTIVDLSRSRPAVLRPGAITREMLTKVLGETPADPDHLSPQVSGSLPSHYAPQAKVQLYRNDEAASLENVCRELREQGKNIVVIAAEQLAFDIDLTLLNAPREPHEFAHAIYALLRQGDDAGADVLLVIPPPETGIGIAIWDRLRKAAAPRD